MNSTPSLPSEEAEELALEFQASELLIAKLSILGHTVSKNRSGGFLVSRWGLTRHCADLESLKTFAKQVGVKL